VRKLSQVFRQKNPEISISYYHKNDNNLLADIDDTEHIKTIDLHEHNGVVIRDGAIFINTWYAQKQFHYMNRYGITFDCLYSIFDDACKTYFDFSLSEIEPDPSKWFPTINFSKFDISHAKQKLDICKEQLVLVSNGNALSGQAENFSMLPAICNLAKKYHGIVFILTNRESNFNHHQYDNIFYSSDLIKKNGFDLNENAFISTYCKTIIGRASGAQTFSMIQENLFDHPKNFICFSNLGQPKENAFWLSELFKDKIQYKSKIIVSNITDSSSVENLIESNIYV
jgi:hypothetical protein